MTKLVASLITMFLALPVCAETSVWKAEKNGQTVYLGGTIHLLRKQDYPLPEEFDQAYQKSAKLVFEVDIGKASSPSIQTAMFTQLSYSDDRTVKSVLSKETYDALEKYATSRGISLEFYRKAKPGLLTMLLMVMELQQIGVTPEGIDKFYFDKAKSDAKSLDKLETIEEQIAMFAKFGENDEEKFYKQFLNETSQIRKSFLEIIKHWKSGDVVGLEELINAQMKNQSPEVYKMMLTDRNNRWMPKVESFFNTEEVEFVLVGAAHLIGESGLVTQLKAKGYKVEKL